MREPRQRPPGLLGRFLSRMQKARKIPTEAEFLESDAHRLFSEGFRALESKQYGRLVSPQGEHVKGFVDRIHADNEWARLIAISEGIARLPRKRVTPSELRNTYARRTAEQIFSENSVHVMGFDEGSRIPEPLPKKPPLVDGCVDHAHAAIAALGRLNRRAMFFRKPSHSFAIFQAGGKFFAVDPHRHWQYGFTGNVVRPLDRQEFNFIMKGNFKLGLDAEDIGLSYDNFF